MLTEKAKPAAAPKGDAAASPAPAPRNLDDLICYFQGAYVPLRDANVSIMTHAFMYGTATFEGIRAYWNAEQQQLYGLFIQEHVDRIRKSARILLMDPVQSADELTQIILETVRRNKFREDAYIRPSFYKSTRAIGVRLHHLEHELDVITVPFGDYIDTTRGIRIMSSSWRRNADEAIPARGKIVGGVREHGVPEERGGAQRLRRGARPDGRRPRLRGIGGEPVHRPRRRRRHAARLRRHPRGHHRARR